jgi:UDP-3-O-[3-hydroxymyristoyl] glucosamine N-acyltransferase
MKLADIADHIGGVLEGDGSIDICGLSSLSEASAGDITFLANRKYASDVATTSASAVLVGQDWEGDCPCALLRVDDVDSAYSQVGVLMTPPPIVFAPGIHATAVIAEDATIGSNVYIGPHCVVEPQAVIGNDCVLVAGVYIGHACVLGEACVLHSHVSLRERSILGDRVIIHNGSVVGSDGFGYAPDGNGVWQKVVQLGNVAIGDDVELGANVTIDRSRFGSTMIGNGVKIDNLVQIAHNVRLGAHSVMAAQSGISGSTHVGSHVQVGGQAGIVGHLNIGDRVVIGGKSGVTKDIESGMFISGFPAMDHRKATKIKAHLARLPELKKRVVQLEAEIAAMKKDAVE